VHRNGHLGSRDEEFSVITFAVRIVALSILISLAVLRDRAQAQRPLKTLTRDDAVTAGAIVPAAPGAGPTVGGTAPAGVQRHKQQ
jgi:hypothetical protein